MKQRFFILLAAIVVILSVIFPFEVAIVLDTPAYLLVEFITVPSSLWLLMWTSVNNSTD